MSTPSGPKALTQYILHSSKFKANKGYPVLMIQGITAGLYIALGAIASLKVSAAITTPGLGDFLGAVVFPVGIIAILIMQAELFTSDCMVMIAVYTRHTTITKIFRILLLVFFCNLLGAIFAAFLTQASGIFSQATIDLVSKKALHKVELPFAQLLASSILCNIIVCTGVCLAYASKDDVAKVITLWLAITVFVISGTEHVVANMYYLFVALFYGAPIPISGIVYNLGIAGIGNFIGGGIIVSGINYVLSYKDVPRDAELLH